jgi:hypothetical protein
VTSRSGATGCANGLEGDIRNRLGSGYSKPIRVGRSSTRASRERAGASQATLRKWPCRTGIGVPAPDRGCKRPRHRLELHLHSARRRGLLRECSIGSRLHSHPHIVPTSRLGGRERRPSSRSPASRPERACQATSGVALTASGGSWSDRTPLPLRKLSSGTTAEGASRNSRRNRCRHRSQKGHGKRRFDFRGRELRGWDSNPQPTDQQSLR